MNTLAEDHTNWDEVRQHHDAWMEQSHRELLGRDPFAQDILQPEPSTVVDPHASVLELVPYDS